MEDERDAEDAIRALDRTEFGQKGRRLRVEWTKVMLWYCYFLEVFKLLFCLHSHCFKFLFTLCSSMSVALEGLRVGVVDQEDLQQTQDLQRLYLSSILILITLELGIWKGTSSHMER